MFHCLNCLGATFLQKCTDKFINIFEEDEKNKCLENVLVVLAHLYNFKVRITKYNAKIIDILIL